MTQKLTMLRLQKETADLAKTPLENAIVERVGNLNFHFCLHSLHPPYAGGLYHGLLELHENYPLRAPKLYFFTPSGRFEVNTPICTSFTHFHQETWTSAWNVRTLILATISFMYAEEPSYGCRSDSEIVRRTLALQSRSYNLRNPEFVKIFRDKLEQTQIKSSFEMPTLQQKDNNSGESIKNNGLIQRNEDVNPKGIEDPAIQPPQPINNINYQRRKLTVIVLFCIFVFLIVF